MSKIDFRKLAVCCIHNETDSIGGGVTQSFVEHFLTASCIDLQNIVPKTDPQSVCNSKVAILIIVGYVCVQCLSATRSLPPASPAVHV